MTSWIDPRTWFSGEEPPSIILNQHIRDQFRVLSEPWPAYAPSLSGITTLGNGAITGSRIIAGKLCLFQITLTIGSSTTPGSATLIFGLPAAIPTANMPVGGMAIFSGGTLRQRKVYANTTTTCASSDEAGTLVTGATPLALASGATIKISGVIQLA